jgi:O-acetyl-ADP-ribose deacetylase (regulator of RNase III)
MATTVQNGGIPHLEITNCGGNLMIKIVNGDLLSATENIIAHQVNCQGKMNSGVAKSIRQTFPQAYNEYMMMTEPYVKAYLNEELLGMVQFVQIQKYEKYIANIFGQLNYGYDKKQYTNPLALYEGFKKIRLGAEKHGLSVAMPYMIGCYRGGADWKEVEDLLLTAFDGYEVTLYKLHRG